MANNSAIGLARLILSNPKITLRLLSLNRVLRFISSLINRPGNTDQLYRKYKSIYQPSLSINTIYESYPNERHPDSLRFPDIVIFPVIDWDFRHQRPQHLSRELGRLGCRVFYLSATPLIASSDTDYAIQSEATENVFVVQVRSSSFRIADPHIDILTDLEIHGYSNSLMRLKSDFKIFNPVALVQHPFWCNLLLANQWRKIIYDCMDYHAGFVKSAPNSLLELESKLIINASHVVVTSTWLAKRVAEIKESYMIRNACDYSIFSNVPRREGNRPTIGYVGAISSWFDVDVVEKIAKERAGWEIVLVGSTQGTNISKLKKLRNVKIMGEVDYSSVPNLLASFTVCLIPFKLNKLTEATNPVKLYEYLAAGRPVVASKLPELVDLEEVDVFLSQGLSEYLIQIERALTIADDPERIRVRREWARVNSWSTRAQELLKLICQEY